MLLGCLVAVALALGGCGGGATTTTTRSAPGPGRGEPPTVGFKGGSLPGTVYLGAGPDIQSLDLYRLGGPLSQTTR